MILIKEYQNDNWITVFYDSGKYLKLKESEESVNLIGKPERIIFSNLGEISEFEEEDLIEMIN